jgi:hypothetical protein
MFLYARRSTNGTSIPSWLSVPGPVYLKRTDRTSKYDPLVEEVQLVKCDPLYAHIVHSDGRNECVSLRRLAPKHGELSDTSTESAQFPTTVAEEPLDSDVSNTGSVKRDADELNIPESLTNQFDTSSNLYADLLHTQNRTHPYNLRNREA